MSQPQRNAIRKGNANVSSRTNVGTFKGTDENPGKEPIEGTREESMGSTSNTPPMVDVKAARIIADRHQIALPKALRSGKGSKFNQGAVRYFRLHQHTNLVSDAANTIAASFAVRDPSGAVDYSSIAALFDEYKVIGYKLQFFTFYPNGSSLTINYDGIAMAFDSDDSASTAPSSLATVIGYENVKMYPLWTHWTHRIKSIPDYIASQADGQAAPGWNRVGFECLNGRLLIYQTGLEASTSYGSVLVTYEIAFRMRT